MIEIMNLNTNRI